MFAGNKAINENKFDNCKENLYLNKTVAETFLIQLVIGDIACQKLP